MGVDRGWLNNGLAKTHFGRCDQGARTKSLYSRRTHSSSLHDPARSRARRHPRRAGRIGVSGGHLDYTLTQALSLSPDKSACTTLISSLSLKAAARFRLMEAIQGVVAKGDSVRLRSTSARERRTSSVRRLPRDARAPSPYTYEVTGSNLAPPS